MRLSAAGAGRPAAACHPLSRPVRPATAAPPRRRPPLPCHATPDDPLAALGLAPPPLDGDLETLQAAAGVEEVEAEGATLTSFGSDAAAASALKSEAGVALVDAGGWTVLRIGGPGAAAFLHAQSTADVTGRDLAPGTVIRTAFTTPTAGCLASGVALVQEGGSLLLLLGPGGPGGEPLGARWGGAAVAKKLALAASLPPADPAAAVAVDDVTARCAVFGLLGPGSGAALARLGARAAAELAPGRFTMLGAGPGGGAAPVFILSGTGLASVAGFTILADRQTGGAADLWGALSAPAIGAVPAGSALWHAVRVEDGAPAPGAELDGKHTPLEAGLGAGWVSVAKGCYLGAEALTKVAGAPGRLKAELWGLRIAAPPGVRPSPGDAVVVGDGGSGSSSSSGGGPPFGRLSSVAPVLPGGTAAAGGGALALAYLSPARAPGGPDALKPGLRVTVACSRGGGGGEGGGDETTAAAAVVEALPHADRARPPLAEKKKSETEEGSVAAAAPTAPAAAVDAAAARAAKLAAMKARLDAWQAEQQAGGGEAT